MLQTVLNASGMPGDREVLQKFNQTRSLILNSAGRRNVFNVEHDRYITAKREYHHENHMYKPN